MIDIGKILDAIRKDNNLTYEQLGDAAGIDRGHARKYCKGQICKDPQKIIKSLKKNGYRISIVSKEIELPIEGLIKIQYKAISGDAKRVNA